MGRIMPLALLRCLSLPKASAVTLQNEVNPLKVKQMEKMRSVVERRGI